MVPAIGPGRSTGPIAVLRARGPHLWCGPLAPPRRLEAADAVRRTQPCGAVVAGLGGTEVAARRVRREVRPLRDVVEARLVAVRVRAVDDRLGVACERVDTRDDGRCDAGAGDDAPAADLGRGVVDRDVVGDRPAGATCVVLPRRLRLPERAAAAGSLGLVRQHAGEQAPPHALAPATP